jgi:uncharacterized protein (TIGR02284 family)
MESTKQTIEILQDLIQINNDRIIGYERAIKELNHGDEDLKILFAAMIAESHHAKLDLAEEVQVMGKDVEGGTTSGGKIYRVWMDVKSLFTGHSRHAILDNCHMGEDAAQKAYASALAQEDLPAYLRELIHAQMRTFKASHDEVKALSAQEAES